MLHLTAWNTFIMHFVMIFILRFVFDDEKYNVNKLQTLQKKSRFGTCPDEMCNDEIDYEIN